MWPHLYFRNRRVQIEYRLQMQFRDESVSDRDFVMSKTAGNMWQRQCWSMCLDNKSLMIYLGLENKWSDLINGYNSFWKQFRTIIYDFHMPQRSVEFVTKHVKSVVDHQPTQWKICLQGGVVDHQVLNHKSTISKQTLQTVGTNSLQCLFAYYQPQSAMSFCLLPKVCNVFLLVTKSLQCLFACNQKSAMSFCL